MIRVPILYIQWDGEPVMLWESDGVASFAEYAFPSEARKFLNHDDTIPVLDLRQEYNGEIKRFVEKNRFEPKLSVSTSHGGSGRWKGWYVTLDLVFDRDADGIYFKMWLAG